MNDITRTLTAALFASMDSCPACGDQADYCQGHGEIGDPEGFATVQEWLDYPDAFEWFDGWALEIVHYSQHGRDGLEPERTEILIGFGGPNVRVIINHKFETAHLWHSWNGEEYIPWNIAREFADRFCPHPLELGLEV